MNIAIDIAKHEHELRRLGKDVKQSQIIPVEQDLSESRQDIILPLNILWDAAALIRNRLFSTPYNWIVETVDFILLQTEATVAVRQHPHERKYEQYATGTRLGRSLQKKFGNNSRFIFYSSTDRINSYKLVEQSKVVLPYTSTIGIEAALMGKHVIMESNVYYVDQPFVTKAESKEDYFNKIQTALRTPLTATVGSAAEKGWLLYYLLNKCTQVYSPFGLDPADFVNWAPFGLEGLLNDENLITALRCLAENIPFAYTNGRKLLGQLKARNRSVNTPYAYLNCKRRLERLEDRSCRVIEWPIENDEEIRQKLSEIIYLINNEKYNQALEVIEESSFSFEDIYLYPKAFLLAKLGQTRKSKDVIDKLNKIKPDNQKAIDLRDEISMSIVKL